MSQKQLGAQFHCSHFFLLISIYFLSCPEISSQLTFTLSNQILKKFFTRKEDNHERIERAAADANAE
jgi:hypothetical protein